MFYLIWCLLFLLETDFYLICLQNAGSFSFSIGITEVLNTNIVIELSANDVDYVYQRYYSIISLVRVLFGNNGVLLYVMVMDLPWPSSSSPLLLHSLHMFVNTIC